MRRSAGRAITTAHLARPADRTTDAVPEGGFQAVGSGTDKGFPDQYPSRRSNYGDVHANCKHCMEYCEGVLKDAKRYNTEHCIWPSENIVVDRFIKRRLELRDAYEELHSELSLQPEAVKTFFDAVLSTAALWNPERISEARRARDDLARTNERIAKAAAELANLLDERSHLGNTSGFRSPTHYHVCDVLIAAGADNYSFKSYVQEGLDTMRMRFDLKYWPRLGDFMRVLASDAATAQPEATDPLTAAATDASRASLADFFKALYAALDENTGCGYALLPVELKISDATIAALVNCALDLDEEVMVDGPYVKRLRQRERSTPEEPRKELRHVFQQNR